MSLRAVGEIIMFLRPILRRAIEVRRLCPQLGALRHRSVECGREQLDSGHCSGTMDDVAKKIREHIGVEGGYHAIPKCREGLLKFQPDRSDLPGRSMIDSQTTANILLESDALMRERFVYGRGLLRMGRIMEELDLLAVWICHRHVHLPKLPKGVPLPYTFVTLLVDHGHFLVEKFKADVDVSLSGHVSWSGNSSLEIMAYVRQSGKLLAKAIFMIAARDATNSGPAPVNPLTPANELEECLYQEALERQKRREGNLPHLESNRKPSKEEEQIMYEVFTRTKGIEGPTPTDMTALPPNCRWMSKWHRRTLLHPFPEHRNEANTIFGGFIIRKGIEIAFITASLFSNGYPVIEFISDVTFPHPIPVHSYMKLKAYVVYTQDNYVQLMTVVDAIDGKSFTQFHSNTLHLTYSCRQEVPEVLPRSYSEALWYLSGRRYLQRFREFVDRDMEGSESGPPENISGEGDAI
ncbi:acyl-coenzyme A thioesterase 9, mitochondrial [Drosophila biarmipes]|uniref:acyl-coenzyme A thioesterase 9, mitochondrial n=1 Tax=Drosophila biarmipes TaxID=125945 RepID=UPI001CDA7EFA|nr:acyl-coenzyme A thioesterase 9, mitochondrial [Drosophila biarmipes]